MSPAAPSLATAADLPRLFEVWESSVRATHDFLAEADLQFLIPLVKQGLADFGPIHCLRDEAGRIFAFLGVAGDQVEMLFVHADHRGRGAGRRLMDYALRTLGATRVDVNEQNGTALGFYLHLGFRPVGRSALDPSGMPFPILHLALSQAP
ncbi:MAG TPA: GNAT family N-acetyltransferase [Holophagaceae bacterium]|nr:GNAT family N-acetyltransferase [Holophagaceae bacterium]